MILLNPGPVNVSPRVTAALARGDLCHREPEYAALQARVRAGLLRAFAPAGDFTAVLLAGSGTAAVEAAVTSVLSEHGKLVVVANGVYGERIAAIATAARLPHTVVASEWRVAPDLGAIERALDEPHVEAVAVVQHETTTGLLNPVAEIARRARARGKLVLVDAVSGLAGDALDLTSVDLVAGTAGKCIQAFPGLAFVLVREPVMARLASHPRRSLYLSLGVHHEAQERGTVAFTPPVQLAYALDAALDELLDEGVEARIARYAAAAALLRTGFTRLDLAMILPPALRSNSITALALPAGRTYADLHDGLKARGFVIYEGQGKLAQELFRVANMGHLAPADFQRFLDALGAVVRA